jgi:hypothetical protein
MKALLVLPTRKVYPKKTRRSHIQEVGMEPTEKIKP